MPLILVIRSNKDYSEKRLVMWEEKLKLKDKIATARTGKESREINYFLNFGSAFFLFFVFKFHVLSKMIFENLTPNFPAF